MYDFCINGGGMVGAALALGLAQQHYKVAVIEPALPKAFDENDGPDLRVSAISDASVTLLKALGAWQYIQAMRVKPYTGLSVWEDEKHRTDFTADSINIIIKNIFFRDTCWGIIVWSFNWLSIYR